MRFPVVHEQQQDLDSHSEDAPGAFVWRSGFVRPSPDILRRVTPAVRQSSSRLDDHSWPFLSLKSYTKTRSAATPFRGRSPVPAVFDVWERRDGFALAARVWSIPKRPPGGAASKLPMASSGRRSRGCVAIVCAKREASGAGELCIALRRVHPEPHTHLVIESPPFALPSRQVRDVSSGAR
jgi:hypothetical protein